jgi:O-acetylserine/cysteine efflux transporter
MAISQNFISLTPGSGEFELKNHRLRPIIMVMKSHRTAIVALAAAGALWGLTVPLSKLALAWLTPGWLTLLRLAVAAPVLALVGRRGLRDALRPRVAGLGAVGYGAVLLLQNAGIAATSVSHAALLVGAVPVIVALIAAAQGQPVRQRVAWVGYALSLAGIGLIAGGHGGGASLRGDLLVLGSASLSAAFIALQPGILSGRDPAAVTAVQFAAAALLAVPFALLSGGPPRAPTGWGDALAVAALALGGTVLPFWLFAFGQSRVSPALAGAFVNLEPVVGATVGWLAFGEAAGARQLLGAAAVLAGIALSTRRSEPAARRRRPPVVPRLPDRPQLQHQPNS